MSSTAPSRSEKVRSQLNHPVIDSDGHQVNFGPAVEDYVRAIGGSDYAVRYIPQNLRVLTGSDGERSRSRNTRPVWWIYPTANALDRATSALPRLLYERLDELGIDYTVLYPSTMGFQVYRVGSESTDRDDDPELRRVTLRATNAYRLDICREFADRMTPAVTVSMTTPEEAIEDLDYTVNELGGKVIHVLPVLRPIESVHERYPGIGKENGRFDRHNYWLDTFGLDSEYDYDPFWKRAVELNAPLATHGTGLGFTGRASPTNHVYNHMGHFADAGEAFCKSLFLGGVTRRFPQLKFAFLEGGGSTGARIYCDLFPRWEKRGRDGIQGLNPAGLDRQLFYDLHVKYGGEMVEGRLDQVLTTGVNIVPEEIEDVELDDFAACGIERPEDIRDLFIPHFFFGCEADDPMNRIAFDRLLLPLGEQINTLFSSDMGHWDVPDTADVVREAYEQVENGLLTDENFRDFVFTNPVKFFAGSNPDFFNGTKVEAEANRLLAEGL
jgi:predicted TIM-barrel fold metal-dependent hydrolase